MSLDNISAVYLAGSYTAVVWPLGSWEPQFGPAIRPTVKTKKSIFLLETEPWLLLCVGVHQSGGLVTVVELVGRPIVIPAFAEYEDIFASTERIWVDSDRAEVDIGVIAWSLAAG